MCKLQEYNIALYLHWLETAQFVQSFAAGNGRVAMSFAKHQGIASYFVAKKDNHFESCVCLVHVNPSVKINNLFSVLSIWTWKSKQDICLHFSCVQVII